MNVHDFKAILIYQGYRYFFLDNVESTETGLTVWHYNLIQFDDFQYDADVVIDISSHEGEEVIQEFLSGTARINLCRIGWCVNMSGNMYRKMIVKLLKF